MVRSRVTFIKRVLFYISLIFIFSGFYFMYQIFSFHEIQFFTISTESNETNFNAIWKHPLCGCLRPLRNAGMGLTKQGSSDCGPAADVRGPGQKVVSYSFYGNTSSGYFKRVRLIRKRETSKVEVQNLYKYLDYFCRKGISVNTEAIETLYDDWVVRLYHDISPTDTQGNSNLCQLICKYSSLDDCFVGQLNINGVDDDLLSKFGMLWRFAVMGDPLVDLFAIRDLDSPIYRREVDAVQDWLADNTTWHIMRDNPFHVAKIMGGMWGGNNVVDRVKMQNLRVQLFSMENFHYKSYDQELLAAVVWPEVIKSMTAHDSFLCEWFENTKPWPTRRVNRTFVGDMEGLSIIQECPIQCRPSNHQDWTFC